MNIRSGCIAVVGALGLFVACPEFPHLGLSSAAFGQASEMGALAIPRLYRLEQSSRPLTCKPAR